MYFFLMFFLRTCCLIKHKHEHFIGPAFKNICTLILTLSESFSAHLSWNDLLKTWHLILFALNMCFLMFWFGSCSRWSNQFCCFYLYQGQDGNKIIHTSMKNECTTTLVTLSHIDNVQIGDENTLCLDVDEGTSL